MKTSLLLFLFLAGWAIAAPVWPIDPPSDGCPDDRIDRTQTMMTISTSMGYLSIACWVIVTLPQLYINWKTGSAEAIAAGLLFCWVTGDVFNLIGCFLVHQLLTQKILAAFYVFADFILIGQMVYYLKINPPDPPFEPIKDEEASGNGYNNYNSYDNYNHNYEGGVCSPNKRPRTGSNLQMAGAALVTTLQSGVVQAATDTTTTTNTSSTLSTAANVAVAIAASQTTDLLCGPNSVVDWIGLVMAWISAVLYLSSRLPQIYKNWQRKSVEGLSLGMFALAVGGNLTYSLSIYLGDRNPSANLPYLVGSMGTMIFDFVVFGQFWIYRKKDNEGEYEKIPDGK